MLDILLKELHLVPLQLPVQYALQATKEEAVLGALWARTAANLVVLGSTSYLPVISSAHFAQLKVTQGAEVHLQAPVMLAMAVMITDCDA